jgi:hypothetical protein
MFYPYLRYSLKLVFSQAEGIRLRQDVRVAPVKRPPNADAARPPGRQAAVAAAIVAQAAERRSRSERVSAAADRADRDAQKRP